MERHGAGSPNGHCVGKLQKVDRLVVPAETELDGDGDVGQFGDPLDYLSGQLRVLHQRRAASGAGYLGNRTACVDVDHHRMVRNGLFHRFLDWVETTHEELHRVVPLVGCPLHQLFGLFAVAVEPLGTDHLGIGEVRPMLDAQRTEGNIGISRHGGEKQVALQYSASHQEGPDVRLLHD